LPNELVAGLLVRELLGESLRRVLLQNCFQVAITTTSVKEFLSDPALAECGVVLVDESAHRADDDLYSRLRRDHPKVGIVLMAETFELEPMMRAFSNGAMGYILKDIPAETLVGSLRLAALGEKVVPSAMATLLADGFHPDGLPTGCGNIELSEREVHVLRSLTLGASNKIIARKLGICEATVKIHVKATLRKLKVSNRTQAAIWAMQHGLFGKL